MFQNPAAKTVFALFLSLAALGVFPLVEEAAQKQKEHTLRIGAWNIEWLGVPENRHGNGPQTAEDIADYILASKVDILGLEEVSDNDEDKETRSNTTILKALAIIKKKTGKTWTHRLFSGVKGGKDLDQLTGIAWNTESVNLVDEPLKINVPTNVGGASIWARHPHAVKLSLGEGKTDIVMIVVHMKANTGGTPPPKKKRELEAKTLMQQLGVVETHFKDFDVIICGDTNILNKSERAATIFTAFGFKDLNTEDENTHVGGAPFDRFFVPTEQPEFAGFDQHVFDEEYLATRMPPLTRPDFRKKLSDHFMVITTVRIMADDDH